MLRLLDALRREHELAVTCPAKGQLKASLVEHGVRQFDLPSTEISFGLHRVDWQAC